MMGLPRRFIRYATYFFSFLSLICVLALIANHNRIIDINEYLPESLTPYFFQPPADLYIIDLDIKNCFKLNSKNPSCGIPKSNEGLHGDLAGSGWVKIDKDLTLSNSILNKMYLNYKTIKHQDFETQQLNKNYDKVITDIVISTPEDRKIKGNKLGIPIRILQEFKAGKVFNEDDVDFYSSHNIQGELYKEDSHKFKASDANREYEQKMRQKEAEAATDKAAEQQNQQDDKNTDQKTPEKETDNKKDEANTKQDKVDKKLPPLKNNDKVKRVVESHNSKLKINYKIPTVNELEENGWVYKNHGMWVKYQLYKSKQAITGIDVLFGEDVVDPRPNWQLVAQEISNVDGKLPVHISFRRGPKLDYKSDKFQKTLKIDRDGKFKILQVADLHFSTGFGKCRDPSPESTKKDCLADPRTLKFVEKVLDIEKPDLVVLTGDQIFGDNSPDAESALFKALNPFIKREIPFAVTLGNHDDEGSLQRSAIMSVSSNLPYSLAVLGPDEVAGVGNYLVNIEDYNTKNSAILLSLLDTHKYSPNPKVNPGYDWIKESQLKFLEREYALFKLAMESFNKIHLDMAFFHIPLPEYRNLNNQPYIGEKKEGITAPKYNTGGRKVLGDLGVKVVSVGHDHCNDYCLQDIQNKDDEFHENKMWLCYGGGSGEGGYGGYGGYIRRLRVYDLDTTKGEIKTWKRLETEPDKSFDEQILVTEGNVVNF